MVRKWMIPVLVATALGVVQPWSAPEGARGQQPPLAVVVHPSNEVRALDRHQLAAIYRATMRFWPDGTPIVAFNAPPNSEHRIRFDRLVLSMNPNEAGRYWIDQRVRGGPRPPRTVPSPGLAIRVVARLRTGIAYAPLQEASGNGVRVVALVDERGVHVPAQHRDDE